MANNNSNTPSVMSYDGFRTMAAWFTDKIQAVIQAAVAYVIDRAGFVYVKTAENAQTILDFFNTHDLYIDGDTYRYIGEVETGPVAGYIYKFGLLNADLTVSTSDVVYGDRRDYDDLQEGDTVYDWQATELTVSQVALPTEGYVALTDFTDPLHVISGTTYGN